MHGEPPAPWVVWAVGLCPPPPASPQDTQRGRAGQSGRALPVVHKKQPCVKPKG